MFIPRSSDLNSGRAIDAAQWYTKAAEQGYTPAQQSLGLLYEGGLGVPKDFVQAMMWYIIASTTASEENSRDFAVQNYNALAREMSPEQIARAQQLAREWRPTRR